ncbi:MAG: hypothetical protein K6F42_05470, partial [Bacteroidales bacterium]|nr:hypothetical protein [Bacteroidales bacterium]
MLKNVLILALLAFALPGKAQPAYAAPAPAAPEIRVPVVGISTNIPYDLTWVPGYGVTSVPSFSVEYFPARWERWTVGA